MCWPIGTKFETDMLPRSHKSGGFTMKCAASFCVLVWAAVLSSHANALHKCVTQDGVVYQDRPCLTGTDSVVQVVVPAFGESPPTPTRYARAKVEPSVKEGAMVAVPVSIVAIPPPKK
jgi:hypothetical protein